jgi:hypothetical protein
MRWRKEDTEKPGSMIIKEALKVTPTSMLDVASMTLAMCMVVRRNVA